MNPPLYSREILALAVGVAEWPPLPGAAHHASERAPLCGSRVAIDLDCDDDDRIASVGLRVEACALGQASACLFARGAIGRDRDALAAALHDLTAWLTGVGATPDWPGLTILAPARAFPARHGAIILPFAAALAATDS